MNKLLILSCIVSIVACSSPVDLKTSLEMSYKNFTSAYLTKDAMKLKSSTSKFWWINTKNMVLSSGSEFPKILFEAGETPPDVGKVKFLKACENGSTAQLVYWSEAENSVLMLRFNKEENGWKFNELVYRSNEATDKIAKGDLSPLETQEFLPTGIAIPVPEEIVFADFVGMLDVSAIGCKVMLKVNGIEQRIVENKSSSGIIIGGVKKNNNTLEFVTVAAGDGNSSRSVKISVRARINNEAKEVFNFQEALDSVSRDQKIFKKEFILN
jgi:hypothetical protein